MHFAEILEKCIQLLSDICPIPTGLRVRKRAGERTLEMIQGRGIEENVRLIHPMTVLLCSHLSPA